MQLNYSVITEEQEAVLQNPSHELLLWGPGGSGKTHISTVKAIIYGLMYPKNVVFLIRRKKVDLRATLWRKFLQLLPREAIIKKDDNQMICTIMNGTEFWGLGLDSIEDVNKLASTESGFIVVEEATEIDQRHYDEKVQRSNRLPSVPFHQILLLCNPAQSSHWINQSFIQQKKKDNIYMPTLPKSCGILPLQWYEYLNNLTGLFAQRYREGKWVSAENIVYPFDPQQHIIKPFPLPRESGERIIAIDFGFSHPFVCQWWYISSDEKWYLYRQIYITGRRVEENAKDILAFCEEDGIIEPEAICDHDAENMADLRHIGINTIRANKARLAGQQEVYKLFEQNRIFFFENNLVELDVKRQMLKLPTKTEDEFPLYSWATKGKEDMIKEFDDGMDAMRYAIYTHASRQGVITYFGGLAAAFR